VVIRATDTELKLSGSPSELRNIASQIVQLKPGCTIRLPADQTADPAPYPRLLVALEVVASSGAVKVSVIKGDLLATGSAAALATFASFFQFEDCALSGAHGHHEWYPGNEYIDSNSRPLVISCT
jgi:hypothetical protein